MRQGESDFEYYRRRAAAEDQAAQVARDERARVAHRDLAVLYQQRASVLATSIPAENVRG